MCERQHYGYIDESPITDNRGADVLMTYRVDTFPELIPWLRSWGSAIEVLEPRDLRETLRAEAVEIAELLR
jgi:predicted DNA-binding transcriptional regulator YafY